MILNSAIVWDVDETLGSFGSLDNISRHLEDYIQRELTEHEINILLDTFPEILRPNIIKTLRLLHNLKRKKVFQKMIIFTNNVGPNMWIDRILNYISNKIKRKGNQPLFDQVIRAYKINNNMVEPNRTQHNKTRADLLKCMNVDDINHICFIDDQSHPLLTESNVDGLHIPPYYYEIDKQTLINRLLKSEIHNIMGDLFEFNDFTNKYYDSNLGINSNVVVYNKMDDDVLLNHVKQFTNKCKPCTKSIKTKQIRKKNKRTKTIKI